MADMDTQATTEVVAQAQAAPQHGEPCEECAAPLAADQRYCLNCGHRRGGPRVDYRHYMEGVPAASDQPVPTSDQQQPPAAEPAKTQRDYAPLAAVGGIAILGLMLLVGVLIGKGNSDNTAATPAPVVIKGPSGEASGVEGGTGSSEGTSGNAPSASGAKKAKQGGGGNSGGTGKAHKATTDELEEHSSASGESYEKQSENLPNEIATPGEPPPIDKSKPAGGGEGGAEVIK